MISPRVGEHLREVPDGVREAVRDIFPEVPFWVCALAYKYMVPVYTMASLSPGVSADSGKQFRGVESRFIEKGFWKNNET